MKNEDFLDKDNFLEQSDFNFSEIYKFTKRNSKFIFIITFLSFVLSAIHSIRIKPIWQGEFQVVLESKVTANPLISLKDLDNAKINLTEIEILKSPSVMEEVFILHKNLSGDKDLSYNRWLQSKFIIEPVKKTNVLSVKYRDENISNILPILNLVSTKYQDYPNLERTKGLTSVINYLQNQVKVKRLESQESLLKLQQFSLDNSIGDYDGLFPAEISTITDRKDKRKTSKNLISQRYQTQFSELENAESELLAKSVYYKENAPEIIFLKKQIKELKKSLERPREILIEYRTLSRIALRDELVVTNLENQLAQKEIEREIKRIPYNLITKPTLDELRVAPKRKQIVLFWTSLSLVICLLITFWRASNSDLILSKSIFDKLIPFKFLKKIRFNNEEIDTYLLNIIGKNCFKEKTRNYNLIVVDKDLKNYYSRFCDQISTYLNQKNIFIKNNLSNIGDDDINYLIVKTFSTKSAQISNLLEDIKILNTKISGWFLIDNE